jgi:hypothetical protein
LKHFLFEAQPSAMADAAPPPQPPTVMDSSSSAPLPASPSPDDLQQLRLKIKTLDERVFDVEAAASMSVADFRSRVALATAVPAPRQRLIYRGKLLKDGSALGAYDLQDGHTVHLVAKPPATRATASASTATDGHEEEPAGSPRRSQALGPDVPGPAWNLASLRSALRRSEGNVAGQRAQPLPMLRELLDEMDESPQDTAEAMGLSGLAQEARPGRQDAAAQNADLEPITQGILTMRTVLSTAAVEQEWPAELQVQTDELEGREQQEEQSVRRGPRQFFIGQWLDVKDTVNQWLESTVMDIADGKVLIHYHGWPTRWDEWIDFDSDRIATFRTRTLHTQSAQRMSPVPTTRVPSAPRVGDNDVRRMVVDVRNLMREMMPHIDRLADLCEDDLRREQERNQAPQQEADAVSASSVGHDGESPAPTTATPEDGQARESEVSEVAHLVAPLFDRFGRLLVDSVQYFDPLLRPELRGTSQRQQERRSTLLRRGHGGSAQRQAASVSTAMEAQDNSLSIRDLIATSPNTPSESNQPRRSIDVHIHAIVAPASLSSFASLSRGNNDRQNSPDAGVSAQRVQMPSTPPARGSFGFDDSRNSDSRTSDDEVDHSRLPLLGSYHHRSHSQASERSRQQRAAARDLDNFLSDDFFGTSFGRDDENEDSDDDSSISYTHSDAMQSGRSAYRPPSPSGTFSPGTPRSEDSPQNSSSTIGVIPEVAAAEERLRAQAEHAASRQTHSGANENGRASSASVESTSSASSAGFPTFLEVMRRTLSGVRNLVHNETTTSSPSEEVGQSVAVVSGFSLPSISSSSSSSPLSSAPASPVVGSPSANAIRRPRSPSESSVEEDLDLDEVD